MARVEMTDLELIKKCADRMGIKVLLNTHPHEHWRFRSPSGWTIEYDPLTNDAQALNMVKKFDLNILKLSDGRVKVFVIPDGGEVCKSVSQDLNSAICECVAKLEK